MAIMIGSARHDEKGGYTNGAKGDSVQTTTPDYRGEVSMQKFYEHSKGWYVIRAKDPEIALKIAQKMKNACNNKNLGYSQSDRYGVIKNGINTKIPSNCDCSSLVRACVKEAAGKDPGDFTTSNAVAKLTATGLFDSVYTYKPNMALNTGDILCTKTKGHIVVVTDGATPTLKEEKPLNGNPYSEPTKNVRLNSKGNDVRWLQYELNRRGYKLLVDGKFGSKVLNCLMSFQKDANILVDGICGPETRKALLSFS